MERLIFAVVVAALLWLPLMLVIAGYVAWRSHRFVPDYQRLAVQRWGQRQIFGPGLIFIFDWIPWFKVDQVILTVDLREEGLPILEQPGLKLDFLDVSAEPVEARLWIKVVDVAKAVFAIDNYRKRAAELVENDVRSVCNSMTMDAAKLIPDFFVILPTAPLVPDRQQAIKDALDTWGLEMMPRHITIADFDLPKEIVEARQKVARMEREAAAAQHEATRLATMTGNLHTQISAGLVAAGMAQADADKLAWDYVTRVTAMPGGKIIDIRSQGDLAAIVGAIMAAAGRGTTP